MFIKKIIVSSYGTNCYFLTAEKTNETIIIDPGDEAEKIFDFIEKNSLIPKAIILTHRHIDHIGALEETKKKYKIGALDLKEGDKVKIGNEEIEVIETPGHTPDSVCFVGDRFIVTGDTLFNGSIGRTDFKGGNFDEMKKSLLRLTEYPDDFKIYPGHGLESTIGEEKKNNPFISDIF
ncbi:MAG: MBL fold metallo-hydrolase [Candidatus Pacebacteria bacterium]|nr:MBL fold metallo-hydrolase [Candidatus Paceibacterota bacterium]